MKTITLLSETDKKFSKSFIPLLLSLLFIGLAACSQERPELEVRTVSDEEARTDTREIMETTTTESPDDLEVTLWASEKLIGDPIAIHMDDKGEAWVTVTNRSRSSEFDIRDVDSSWLSESMQWETVEDRRNFLHEELAPEKSEENTWLTDHNEDGSHDWHDLQVQKEEVWRITDQSGDGLADRSQLFIRDFNDEVSDVAGAVVHHNDEVFIGVGPDMWRARDTNDDGMSDWKESIVHGFNVHIGFSGHGMSGLTVGPDGRIYWGIGDMGFSITDQDGKEWHYPNRGAIFRSEPDGSNFEVFAMGVRNTHEFTFDKYGNLITVDNDGDHAGEEERLVYLVNGSDSGWRINWQFGKYTDPKNNDYKVWMDEDYYIPHWEDQAAHILPPLANFHTGPAGMAYNPGTALNENWKDHFFLMSFYGSTATSPIYAFTLEESGASFELESEQVALKGVLAVGLDFGPDGALYMTDWIEGWSTKNEGRIWKLDSPEDAESDIRVETKNLLAEDFDSHAADQLIDLMGHEDMRVRQKAQFELAERDDRESLHSAINGSENQFARIHGIWGLAQIGRQDIEAVEPLINFLDDSDPEIRAQVAKMLGDVRYEAAAETIVPMLNDENARVRFFAAEALGRMEFEQALPEVVNMLEENDDEDIYLRHAGAIAMARFGDGEALTELSDHSSRAVRIAAIIALKRLNHPGAAEFLQDEDEYVVTNAARAISDDKYATDAIPALAQILDQDKFDNEPLIRRAINASLYNGTAADAERLSRFALNPDNSENLRIEALNTLEHWEAPSIFDRVTGRHRGQIQNDPGYAHDVAAPVVEQLLNEGSDNVKTAVIEMIAGLNYEEAIPDIADRLQNDSSADVRISALNNLQRMDYEQIDEAVRQSLEDDDQSVRLNALSMIESFDLPEESKSEFLVSAFPDGTVEEKQIIFNTLESLDNETSHRFLDEQLERLINEEVTPEIQLDLILAAESQSSEQLQNKLGQYQESKPAGDPVAQYRESLRGGNANSGRQIFYQNAAAQCIRCHAVNDMGGEVGPKLNAVSTRLNREKLLESMVAPSVEISPGFGVEIITLENGETIRGVLEEETETQLIISSREQRREIDKSEISERDNTPSSMPAMGDILSRRELRDLVEFMTTLDGSESE